MSEPATPIGLLGYGTVGSAVDRLLRDRAEDIARVAGGAVSVRRALVRDLERPRGAPDGVLTGEFAAPSCAISNGHAVPPATRAMSSARSFRRRSTADPTVPYPRSPMEVAESVMTALSVAVR